MSFSGFRPRTSSLHNFPFASFAPILAGFIFWHLALAPLDASATVNQVIHEGSFDAKELRWETDPIEARASPRNPSVLICNRSSAVDNLLVACRETVNDSSSDWIPEPSSATSMRRFPASLTLIEIFVAPASSEFSTSSLTTEAGRSTTSPAAIWEATSGAKTWMDMKKLYQLQAA